jgi:adenylate cyclase
MEANKSTTVLFAEPSIMANRHEACRRAIAAAIIRIVDSTGGRVVKSVGGKLMVVFATPDAAASAASKMHAAIEAMPAIDGAEPGVHVGFHSDPVLRRAGGLSDDTVNLALRLMERAQDGQTLTSQRTAEQLNPALRSFSRPLHCVQERAEEVRLCELASWHQRGVRPPGWKAMAVLRLTYRDQLVVCSREQRTVVLGRDAGCDVVVESKAASREHCTIEWCENDFLVCDRSNNGTYVSLPANGEVLVHNENMILPEEGTIALGEESARAAEVVEFSYAVVT